MMFVTNKTKLAILAPILLLIALCAYFLGEHYQTLSPISHLEKGFLSSQTRNTSTQVLPMQSPEPLTFAAWIPWWDWDNATQALSSQPNITSISPFTYIIQADGSILQKRAVPSEWLGKYTVIPTISHDLQANLLTKILTDPQQEAQYFEKLQPIIDNPNYAGIELDYENLAHTYRDQLTAHVQKVAALTTAANKKLYLALHAKTNDVIAYAGAGSLDYQALCTAADNCRIMAYDYHYSNSKSGSLVPTYWLKEVIEYTLKNVPASKITIALPLYGYQWTDNANGKSVTQAQISTKGGTRKWDDQAYSPYIEANESTVIYYEDLKSLQYKIDYIKSQGISQISFWRLGGEQNLVNYLER